MDLTIRAQEGFSLRCQEVEVVERKGLGHPDSICDALAERICLALCRYYSDRFGVILHHNVDKILLCGGSARAAFGGGEVLAPIELYLGGRATNEYRGTRIPVFEIAVQACRDWLRANLRGLDIDRHVKIVPRLRPGSVDLTGLFAKGSKVPLANDTSCGAGFAPLTDLERVVLDVERTLSSKETQRVHPAIGEDVKVMGVRRGSTIFLTIGCAMIARFVSSLDDYIRAKAAVRDVALTAARASTQLAVDALVNAADDLDRGDIFLTVTGTSAEAGDDGEVGRGNRTSGLITPYRPMTLEAAAGKNPVSHVGKLYNVAAGRMATSIVQHASGVTEADCILVSQIGRPIDEPDVADIRVALEAGRAIGEVRDVVRELFAAELTKLPTLRDALVNGEIPVY